MSIKLKFSLLADYFYSLILVKKGLKSMPRDTMVLVRSSTLLLTVVNAIV